MKKLLALVVTVVTAVACCFGMTGCKKKDTSYKGIKKVENYADIKVGFITLHDSSSTYDKNFIDAAEAVCKELGVQYEITTNIPEKNACYTAAKKYAERKFNIVFADSFGHEKHILKAANEYPGTQFCHATGTKAHTEKRGNTLSLPFTKADTLPVLLQV